MKKFMVALLVVIILVVPGCGKENNENKNSNNKNEEVNLIDGWNGFYKSSSESKYYVMLYTENNIDFKFYVIEKTEYMTGYIIQYEGKYLKNENTLEYNDTFFDEEISFKIVRNGNSITVTSSSTDLESNFNNISGAYTKYKNATTGDVEEFE